MVDTRYWHAELGFGFEIRKDWALELDFANALFPVLVSMRAGGERVMAAVRGAMSAAPSERLHRCWRSSADAGYRTRG